MEGDSGTREKVREDGEGPGGWGSGERRSAGMFSVLSILRFVARALFSVPASGLTTEREEGCAEMILNMISRGADPADGTAGTVKHNTKEGTLRTSHKPTAWTIVGEFRNLTRLLTMLGIAGVILYAASAPAYAQAKPTEGKKPNILVIFGDDIGWSNISAYNMGMMGLRTPNIDRIAKEGVIFTDYYGQQSCTAGRAAFITGQHPFRTGLLKVGLPGADLGLQPQDPTIADLLKNQGYATGQFGKNHLGDRNEFLPTVHGFDEFFGNLYHLNAEEEPEDPQYPKMPEFKQRFGPRGALRCKATENDDPTVDPRFGKIGKQKIDDTGPITRKRMETVEEEFLNGTLSFMERAVKEKKPFFIWHNSTRMHVWTRLQPKYQDKTGYGLYADGMAELDDVVGALLKKIDDLGIADNTIVIFTTDNGAEKVTWPDGGSTTFRGEKGSTWEGGMRVPCAVRWPKVIKPGTVINGIMSHEDWAVTLLAAAGEPDVKEKLLKGHTANGKPFKVHLDGYDQREMLAGTGPSKRNEIFYFDDNGNLNAVRVRDWKAHFSLPGDWFGAAHQRS